MIGILVELTNFGHGIDAAFAALIGYVAVLLVGAAATWWALPGVEGSPGGEQNIGLITPDQARSVPIKPGQSRSIRPAPLA